MFMIRTVSGAAKLIAMTVVSIMLIPLQLMILTTKGSPGRLIMPRIWHRIICYIFSLRKVIKGKPVRGRQTVYICNHISYFDIPVLGSVLEASFVSKDDVADWPVFGFLAKLNDTVFISRNIRATDKEKQKIKAALENGRSLILFPEATSTNGADVLPFKSGFFEAFANMDKGTDIVLQPVSIVLRELNGVTIDKNESTDLYAWYGDMELLPHLWNYACGGGAVIDLEFHPPFETGAFKNRKEMALACYEKVRSPFTSSLRQAA